MNNKSFTSNLINALIKINKLSEGFDSKKSNKQNILGAKHKFLFMLLNTDIARPSLMVNELGMAKSNLAKLARELEEEGFVGRVDSNEDRRLVYYNITKSGKEYLDNFIKATDLLVDNSEITKDKRKKLIKKLDEINKILETN